MLIDRDNEIFCRYESDNLSDVMEDACGRFPEESFCFLNEGGLRENALFFLENFGAGTNDNRFTVAYSVKANSRRRILEILAGSGISAFDCASPNEIRTVKSVMPEAKILYNHPVKREKDIRTALDMGVNHFTAHSLEETEKIISCAHSCPMLIDLEIVVRMETQNPDTVINLSSKFGATKIETGQILSRLQMFSNVITGVSVHTGSQNRNPSIFEDVAKKIADVFKVNGDTHFINFGGGIPVNYFEDDNYDFGEYINAINRGVADYIGGGHDIIVEPGRSMVAGSIDLLIPITSVEKRNGTMCIYFQDGVFGCFSDSAVHGWRYNFRAYSPDKNKTFTNKTIRYNVFGRTCDSGDIIRGVLLPLNIGRGDYLRIANAGAYMDSQTTYFNGFEPPKYISYNPVS